jgi:phospholipid/cholesterol/gamma-HCH transport system substrate-binding protein
MASKAQKVRLGIFLLITLILLVLSFAYIAGNKLMEKKDIYYIEYQNVSVIGLQVGSSVKYYGINIGQVDDIIIDKDDINKVTVQISVKEGTPVKEDMIATLVSIGITGLKQIELTGGSNEADFLEPGSKIEPGVSYLDDITGKAEQIAEKFELLLNNLNAITAPENQKKFHSILTHAEAFMEENREPVHNTFTSLDTAVQELRNFIRTTQSNIYRIEENITKLDTIMDNAQLFSENLATADVREVSGEIINTLNNINTTLETADIRNISEEAVNALTNFNQTITRIDLMVLKSRQDLINSMESLKQATEHLNQFSRQISDNPSSLLRTTR